MTASRSQLLPVWDRGPPHERGAWDGRVALQTAGEHAITVAAPTGPAARVPAARHVAGQGHSSLRQLSTPPPVRVWDQHWWGVRKVLTQAVSATIHLRNSLVSFKCALSILQQQITIFFSRGSYSYELVVTNQHSNNL